MASRSDRAHGSIPRSDDRSADVTISTRLTELFGLRHPIIQAPMATAAGGRLAAAVSNAGGLGLIGGGYGDRAWIDEEWREAGNAAVGIGFITWRLREIVEQDERFLADVTARSPRALFLSFDDPAPFVSMAKESGTPLIAQVQTARDAARAIEVGCDVVVAQGSEAGGHGEKRATMALVPEVVDLARGTDTIVCAAGGIADGRGLAASLMLGAEGVVIGSRFWASREALVAPAMLQAAVRASGDDTIRSSVMDIARRLNWPPRYTARVLRNAFTDRWHHDIDGLLADAEAQSAHWIAAWERGDADVANTFVGEATGLIRDVRPAADIVEEVARDALDLLQGGWRRT